VACIIWQALVEGADGGQGGGQGGRVGGRGEQSSFLGRDCCDGGRCGRRRDQEAADSGGGAGG